MAQVRQEMSRQPRKSTNDSELDRAAQRRPQQPSEGFLPKERSPHHERKESADSVSDWKPEDSQHGERAQARTSPSLAESPARSTRPLRKASGHFYPRSGEPGSTIRKLRCAKQVRRDWISKSQKISRNTKKGRHVEAKILEWDRKVKDLEKLPDSTFIAPASYKRNLNMAQDDLRFWRQASAKLSPDHERWQLVQAKIEEFDQKVEFLKRNPPQKRKESEEADLERQPEDIHRGAGKQAGTSRDAEPLGSAQSLRQEHGHSSTSAEPLGSTQSLRQEHGHSSTSWEPPGSTQSRRKEHRHSSTSGEPLESTQSLQREQGRTSHELGGQEAHTSPHIARPHAFRSATERYGERGSQRRELYNAKDRLRRWTRSLKSKPRGREERQNLEAKIEELSGKIKGLEQNVAEGGEGRKVAKASSKTVRNFGEVGSQKREVHNAKAMIERWTKRLEKLPEGDKNRQHMRTRVEHYRRKLEDGKREKPTVSRPQSQKRTIQARAELESPRRKLHTARQRPLRFAKAFNQLPEESERRQDLQAGLQEYDREAKDLEMEGRRSKEARKKPEDSREWAALLELWKAQRTVRRINQELKRLPLDSPRRQTSEAQISECKRKIKDVEQKEASSTTTMLRGERGSSRRKLHNAFVMRAKWRRELQALPQDSENRQRVQRKIEEFDQKIKNLRPGKTESAARHVSREPMVR